MSQNLPREQDQSESQPNFNLTEYVDAANDAANRSRYVSIVLVVATVLIFVGLNNEYVNSWMVDDLREVYKPGDRYIKGILGKKSEYFAPCGTNDPRCLVPAEQAKRDAQEALMKIHMESRVLVKIPILGVAIHVNDLGLIGGITLIVLLLLTRTSLSREIKNLNYSFKSAYDAKRLDEFYDSLAMRQLFTVPHMKGERRNSFLSKIPYAVCVFPAFVYLSLVAYDAVTLFILPRYREPLAAHQTFLQMLGDHSVLWIVIIEGVCVVAICFIALRCIERQHYIYSIWDEYWHLLSLSPTLCLIEPDVTALLVEGKDYFLDDTNVRKVRLADEVKEKLKEAKKQRRTGRLYFLRWAMYAIKDESTPVFSLFAHAWRFLFRRDYRTERPLMLVVEPDLAESFSNDKELNDTLRIILRKGSNS